MPSLSLSETRYRLRKVPTEWHDTWNSFVDEAANGHVLQSWEWGELKAHAGWHPLRFALWDNEQARIVAAAQVLQRTSRGVPLRVGHLAYIPKGPALDWSQPEVCDSFFRQLHAALRRRGALALRMEPAVEDGTPQADFVLKRLQAMKAQPVQPIQPKRIIMLDLASDEDELLARMKEKWRYNVRLADRKGVTIRVGKTLDDVEAWYRLMQATGERDDFGIHTIDYYQRAWTLFAPQDMARLLLAEYEGQLLAGIFVSCFARQAIYLYGASSNDQRHLMPNYLLQWEAMRWAKQQGALTYDFWGIPETDNPDEAMAGVYRFKRGWGGRIVNFPGCFEYVYQPLAMKLVRRFIG